MTFNFKIAVISNVTAILKATVVNQNCKKMSRYKEKQIYLESGEETFYLHQNSLMTTFFSITEEISLLLIISFFIDK